MGMLLTFVTSAVGMGLALNSTRCVAPERASPSNAYKNSSSSSPAPSAAALDSARPAAIFFSSSSSSSSSNLSSYFSASRRTPIFEAM